MVHHAPALRIGLYFALSIFSIILLGLTGARLHQTLNFAPGVSFHGMSERHFTPPPFLTQLLVTSILAIIWSWFIIHTIHSIRVTGPVTTFRHEGFGYFVIWLMFLVGTAIATVPQNKWANLSSCFGTFTCDILTAIVAFAWLCFITMTLIGISSALFLAGNSGYGSVDEPLHGRWGTGAKTSNV
ncbi:hypothetical protein BDP27DRAFT_1518502 [Rhodocollybia butyracea]|uniref:MARVEL domain-containing protein n=1 Tax=Rhodocollybia butyracea TaxID=206335 RepID=A0A9P5Q9S4_9AGAR|nr:hypothetical protein BDP27DRAFT_1518502 [Rhodocollybia butyracea]